MLCPAPHILNTLSPWNGGTILTNERVPNMPGFKPINPAVKAEILKKLKDEGMRVSEASRQYQVVTKPSTPG